VVSPDLDAIALATFVELLVVPLSGRLSDPIGRRALYLVDNSFGILLAFSVLVNRHATRPSF
jgi:MFS family permease